MEKAVRLVLHWFFDYEEEKSLLTIGRGSQILDLLKCEVKRALQGGREARSDRYLRG